MTDKTTKFRLFNDSIKFSNGKITIIAGALTQSFNQITWVANNTIMLIILTYFWIFFSQRNLNISFIFRIVNYFKWI